MDAFAVSVCAGLAMTKVRFKKALIIGLYFGIFQAVMPVIGYFTAKLFAHVFIAYAAWVAFILLFLIGANMIYDTLKDKYKNKKGCGCETEVKPEPDGYSVRPARMLPLAVATSVDALAVGVSFAFMYVNVVPSALMIGAVTLVISMAGVKIGGAFGARFKTKAELAGGAILILLSFKVLLDHLNVINV